MRNFRSMIFCALLLTTFQLEHGALAQEPVAVVTELKFNRGDIQLRTSSGAAPTKPAVLQSLYLGNVVQTTRDAIVVILFTDGARTVTVNEKDPSFEVRTSQSKDSQSGARVKEFAGLLLGKKRPPTYVPLSVRSTAQPPVLLTPRNTKLLTDTPTFQWIGMEQHPGTVKVFGPQGVIWSAENISLTKITYPASAPRLQPEIDYSWVIEKKGATASKTTFRLLRPADAQAIKERLNELSGTHGLSKTTLVVLKANFLMSRELYHEAREILLEGAAADPDEPTLHFVLGELYDKTGLKSLSQEKYSEAQVLAAPKP